MSIFGQRARVAAARQRATAARAAVVVPASALLARGERHPWIILGAAAGVGLVMGRMKLPPLRLPGMGGLLGALVTEATTIGASFLAAQSGAEDA